MIKKVLVYLYGDNNQDNTIRVAANFSAQHEAELTGLFVRPDYGNYTFAFGEYPLNLAQTYFDLQTEFASKAENQFNKITTEIGCQAEWHEVNEYERQPKPAFYSDFVFVSQPSKESSAIFNDTDFIDHLIVETGLPTVIVPKTWAVDKFGTHPLLGWSETKESIGAVRHTLPLLRVSDNVDIVSVTKTIDRDVDLINGIEISAYLAAHKVNCTFFSVPIDHSDKNEAETLLRHAHENSCDLIIIGGYGHSRLREIVLGGVTRNLIKNSDVPLILSH